MQRAPEATAIVDLQFGSTGKGSLAGWMGEYGEFDAVATSWGPNAGHTSVYADGTQCVRTMLSNAAFRSPTIKIAYIGPGSVVHPENLQAEILDTQLRGNADLQVMIHEAAAVVLDVDRTNEAGYGYAIGSTMKGTAEAVIRKMKRQVGLNPSTMGEWARANPDHPLAPLVVPHKTYLANLYNSRNVLLEGCQGYSLGINSGFWPYCTSRECTLPQLLSDTLMPIHSIQEVIGCIRTYPIRVANRFNAEGKMIGTSGGHYFDQDEIAWADIGREPELTTVTKLPRRLFNFSMMQVKEAMIRNSCNSLFINFMNYLPSQAHQDEFFGALRTELPVGVNIDFLGHGPAMDDIEALGSWAAIKQQVDRERANVSA